MITRIYIDNFRCLVNFELKPSRINLLLGSNGSGKSALFDALDKIHALVAGQEQVKFTHPLSDFTRWQDRQTQTFQLAIDADEGGYEYEVTIGRHEEGIVTKISSESLSYNGRPLFLFDGATTTLYNDDGSKGSPFPSAMFGSASGIGWLTPNSNQTLISGFKARMKRILVLRMVPSLMLAETDREKSSLDGAMIEFASWFRHMAQERQGRVLALTQEFREILDGFDSFKLSQAGERVRVLKLVFNSKQSDEMAEYRLDELSDGQRALLGLYALLHCALAREEPGATLCVDEPENYLALPEIQPWLTSLEDRCSDAEAQAILISHHPEFINYLASSYGFWFERDGEGPTQVKRVAENESAGLSMAELVARGWLYE